MTIGKAIEMARMDAAEMDRDADLAEVADAVIRDGSAYSPSWRALDGGAHVWSGAERAREDVLGSGRAEALCQAYDEELTRLMDGAGLVWDEGMIRATDTPREVTMALSSGFGPRLRGWDRWTVWAEWEDDPEYGSEELDLDAAPPASRTDVIARARRELDQAYRAGAVIVRAERRFGLYF